MCDMNELMRNRAPYNFVPIPSNPICRYEDPKELPPHDKLDSELLTGQIRITVKAETPIFIGAGSDSETKKKTEQFFKAPCGNYAIPGSSFRGLVRTNMQILGLGLIRPDEDFDDYRLMFRNVAGARDAIGADLREYYETLLGRNNTIVEKRNPGGTVTRYNYVELRNVKGGFLFKEGNDYYIEPTDTPIIPVRRSATPTYKNRWAFTESVRYLPFESTATVCSAATADAKEGIILGTGYMKGQDHLYVFPDKKKPDKPFRISEKAIIAYQEDYLAKEKGLRGTDPKITQEPKFWALPEQDGFENKKPVFYAFVGSVVPGNEERDVCFGVSRFLRIPYKHSLKEGLPNPGNPYPVDNPEKTPFLDYPYAILGYAKNKNSFSSRVTVDDFLLNNVKYEGELFQDPVSAFLLEPKPSFFQGYIRDGKHYNDDNFQLRGYKQYWLKDVVPSHADKEESGSSFQPMSAGVSFTGTIHYRNLHPDELGLLLWCITLDKGCYQNIGKGKPYGYGRISVQIDSLRELDLKALYGFGKLGSQWVANQDPKTRISDLIQKYVQFVDRLLNGQSIRKRTTIVDFMKMKKTVWKDPDLVSYMSVDGGDYQNLGAALPTIKDLCEVINMQQQNNQTE